MKFQEALEQFKMEIEKEYGIRDGIIKIGIHPEMMHRVVTDIYSANNYMTRINLGGFGELILNGVQLLPREKDSF